MQYNQRQAVTLLLGLSESKSQKVEGIGSLVVQNREQERKIALPSEKVSAPPPVRGGRGSAAAEGAADSGSTPARLTRASAADAEGDSPLAWLQSRAKDLLGGSGTDLAPKQKRRAVSFSRQRRRPSAAMMGEPATPSLNPGQAAAPGFWGIS